MSEYTNCLFNQTQLAEIIYDWQQQIKREIESYTVNQLLNSNIYDLTVLLEQKYTHLPPKLIEEDICIYSHGDIEIDISGDYNRYIIDRRKPFYVQGTYIEYEIPFTGDADLFKYRPSTYYLNTPEGKIVGNTLRVRYEMTRHDSDATKRRFSDNLQQINNWLIYVRNDISIHTASLNNYIKDNLEARKNKLMADQGMVDSLGFPIRKRESSAGNYNLPVRKTITVMKPSCSLPFSPEPAIEMRVYDEIIKSITEMSTVMERSPSSFRNLNEEALRDHLLVPLNCQYEGPANSETFNYSGKTDILIRSDDKNVFIGECKFWTGPKGLLDTVDQILGYTCWRDTKTAIIIFNRNKNLTNVLKQIPNIVMKHANYKRQLDYQSETGFRFIMRHNDDANRELTLTIIVMEVPTA